MFAFGYIGTVYLTSYGTAVLGLPRPIMLLLGILGGGLLAVAAAVAARGPIASVAAASCSSPTWRRSSSARWRS